MAVPLRRRLIQCVALISAQIAKISAQIAEISARISQISAHLLNVELQFYLLHFLIRNLNNYIPFIFN